MHSDFDHVGERKKVTFWFLDEKLAQYSQVLYRVLRNEKRSIFQRKKWHPIWISSALGLDFPRSNLTHFPVNFCQCWKAQTYHSERGWLFIGIVSSACSMQRGLRFQKVFARWSGVNCAISLMDPSRSFALIRWNPVAMPWSVSWLQLFSQHTSCASQPARRLCAKDAKLKRSGRCGVTITVLEPNEVSTRFVLHLSNGETEFCRWPQVLLTHAREQTQEILFRQK